MVNLKKAAAARKENGNKGNRFWERNPLEEYAKGGEEDGI
jgi:hypothetical protein